MHCLRPSQEGLNFTVLREIKILKELRHRHLLELLGVSVTPDGLELVLELCETDLKKVIENKNQTIRLEDAKVSCREARHTQARTREESTSHRSACLYSCEVSGKVGFVLDTSKESYFGMP
jgi:serine/threonine protein kinase